MSKYATISVPIEVKKRLEELKGEKDWGEFLLEACTEARRLKGKKAFEELRKLLTEEDLETIRKSSKEFRENFKLR
ncbi:MAG: antitoxin VapB family protein [Candidatus Bathyarchaeia archaeon]|jgi:predicted CopG family antitoxin